MLATVFVMFVMQANMNPTHISSPSGVEKLVAEQPGKKLDSKSESVDFPAEAGMLAVMAMPAVSDSSNIEARPTPAHDDRRLVHSNLRLATTRIITSSPQAPANDVNVDGGSPVQPLRPEYVMASASSGNDEDQNHRYVIDTVSNSRASSVSEGSEESHPW